MRKHGCRGESGSFVPNATWICCGLGSSVKLNLYVAYIYLSGIVMDFRKGWYVPGNGAFLALGNRRGIETECFPVEGVSLVQGPPRNEQVDVCEAGDHFVVYSTL